MSKEISTDIVEQNETQSMADRVVALQKQVDLELPDDTGELWNYVVRLENESSVNTAKRGLAYIMLKEECQHGEFLQQLNNRDIPMQRAYEAMNVAKLLLALPASKFRTFGTLAKTKLIELAKIPSETLEELTENEELDLDEIDQMSVRELKQKVRQLKADVQDANIKKETAEIQLDDFLANTEAAPETDLHPVVAKARMESAVLSTEAFTKIDSITTLFDDLQSNSMELFRDKNSQFEAAKGSLFVHLKAIQAKASQAVNQFIDMFGDVDTDEKHLPLMTDKEAIALLHKRKLILMEHRTDELAREAARASKAQQKKRGPKPGSKRKSSGSAA